MEFPTPMALVSFNGTEAVIQNLTGETGGGKVTLSGFAAYGGPEMQFRVQANADGIRVAYPPTVTTQASARLTLAGTTSRSLVSGTVTIQDVALHSHSDMGSLLNSAAAPPSAGLREHRHPGGHALRRQDPDVARHSVPHHAHGESAGRCQSHAARDARIIPA